jgi:hypothetical protein
MPPIRHDSPDLRSFWTRSLASYLWDLSGRTTLAVYGARIFDHRSIQWWCALDGVTAASKTLIATSTARPLVKALKSACSAPVLKPAG